jgi:membrane protease YdiL (CAAX protease family)
VRCLGLWPGRNGRAVLAGALAYALLLPAIIGTTAWWPWVFARLGGQYELQAIVLELAALRGAALAAAVVLAVLVVPLLEELLFRSFLQPLLVQNLGDRGGVAATSVVFAALHGPSAFLPLFALSLVLGFVMLRTQRLAAAWAVHALHNGLQLALLFLVPEAGEAIGRSGLLGALSI